MESDLSNFDFVALIETWHCPSETPKVRGFNVESVSRELASNNRYFGGIVVLIKDESFKSYTKLKSKSENVIWIRLECWDGLCIVIGSIYIPPQNSSYRNEDTWNLLVKELDEKRANFENDRLILMGDFNAYTSDEVELKDVLIPGIPSAVPAVYRIPRASRDEKRRINQWGRRLLTLCAESGLMIGNGRFGKDKNRGEFTCVSGAKASLIDYVLVDIRWDPNYLNVDVLKLVGSDHLPVFLEIRSRSAPQRRDISSESRIYNKNVRRQIPREWSTEENVKLSEAFSEDDVAIRLSDLEKINNHDRLIEEFTEILHEIAGPVLGNKGGCKDIEFFDEECRIKKLELIKEMEILREEEKEENRLRLVTRFKNVRREYKRLLKQKKRLAIQKGKEELIQFYEKSDMRSFWRKIKKGASIAQPKVPDPKTWPTYYKDAVHEDYSFDCWFSDELSNTENETSFPLKEHDYDLIKPASEEEIEECISAMEGGSAPGSDGVPTMILKQFQLLFMPIFLAIFNSVLASGEWPSPWKTSLILPLFKKGDPADHSNYRPISLVPSLSKILERILDARLAHWLEKYRILKEEQAGFRDGYNAIDRVLVLQALVEKYAKGKNRLYVAFLDLEKAFDSIDRIFLCLELLKVGLPRLFVRILADMYRNTFGIVKVLGKGLSSPFEIRKGVKQGSSISPRLFTLYINDIVDHFKKVWAPTVSLGNLTLSLLLFADDAVLIGKSPEELQILLSILEEYLDRKKLVLNIKKTEIVVFRGIRVNNDDQKVEFYYKGEKVKESENFKYLGVTLSAKGGWKEHVKQMIKRGKAVSAAILRNSRLSSIKDLKMHKYVFNSKVLPTIHYGAELWGHDPAPQLESIQLQHFKRLIGLHVTTHNQAIKGDLGIFSLRMSRLAQMIRYWLKVLSLPEDRLAKAAYVEMLRSKRKRSWPYQIKNVLDGLGLSYIWNEGLGPSDQGESFLAMIVERIKDQEVQMWTQAVKTSETLKFYSHVKEIFGFEYYFKLGLPGETLRTWFRIRANCLPLKNRKRVFERNRVAPDANADYSCPRCNLGIEDVAHILTECQQLSLLREKYFEGGNLEFPGILKTTVKRTIRQLCKYVNEALTSMSET